MVDDENAKPEADFVDAGPESQFEPGRGYRVAVGEAGVALFRTPEGFVALRDRCPHAGAPLSDGILRDGELVCSWHGWRFEPGTGRCTITQGVPPVPCHEVRVEDGRVLVRREPRA